MVELRKTENLRWVSTASAFPSLSISPAATKWLPPATGPVGKLVAVANPMVPLKEIFFSRVRSRVDVCLPMARSGFPSPSKSSNATLLGDANVL